MPGDLTDWFHSNYVINTIHDDQQQQQIIKSMEDSCQEKKM